MLTFSIENSGFLCVGWHGKSLLLVPSFLSIPRVSLQGGPCMYKHTDVYAYTSCRRALFCTLLFSLILGIYSVLIPVELLYVFPSLI